MLKYILLHPSACEDPKSEFLVFHNMVKPGYAHIVFTNRPPIRITIQELNESLEKTRKTH